MLLMSCASGKIEYIEKPVMPEVVCPALPELDGAIRNNDGTVSVSEDWLVKLAEYKIRIEETEKNYNEIKALYSRE